MVDEEQHFGVAHKERLKQLKADVHVLTLTATPIPRTLQLALTGVREMSLISTPPVDRLAVRTFIMPFDAVVIREAIQRERFRGGQVFCVVPRIEDLPRIAERLAEIVPEARMAQAHGRLAPTELERVMTEFGDGRYDILLSTNIVESGLDMPAVNTLVIHRADMFGLGQLYQLRGRVGRGKQRGYAYLTWPPNMRLSAAAEKRLTVMQTLDALGAGFTLASHDLDIRGAGNLLGDEQSGHIREVGIELYQQMLEDAVAELRAGEGRRGGQERDWTPNISLGLPVLIPEGYVRDLPVRLGLYRRIGALASDAETEAMAAELVDRFGPLPQEVENLLQVVALKRACREAGVEKLEAGPKGHAAELPRQCFFQSGRTGGVARQQGRSGASAPRPQAGHLARNGCGDTPALRPRRAGQSRTDRQPGQGGLAGFGRLDCRHVEQTLDHLGLLRAGDCVAAGDHEAWDAVDAQPMCPQVIGVHRIHLVIADQEASCGCTVQTARRGDRHQHDVIADIQAVGEMRREQRLDHRVGLTEARCVTYQAMGVDAGWRAADAVEAEQNALAAANLRYRRIKPTRAVLATELADHVVRPRHATSRHVWIEQEGPPRQVEQQVRTASHCAHQPAHAKIAPRADQIVDDLDAETRLWWCEDVHAAIIAGSAACANSSPSFRTV